MQLNPTGSDFLFVLAILALVLVIAAANRHRMESGQAANFPHWIGALALIGAALGAPELIVLGAGGARAGISTACLYVVAAVPALIFFGRFAAPVLYAAQARTLAEYFGRRFDSKTRLLAASLFAVFTIVVSAISLRWMAGVLQSLHVFDRLLRGYGLPISAALPICVVVPAALVLAVVILGRLSGVVYSRVLLFALTFLTLVPAASRGAAEAGGWTSLRMMETDFSGAGQIAMAVALSLLLGAAYWCADFRNVQFALVSKDAGAARRMALLAAVVAIPAALFAVLPGAIAVALPTPATHTSVHVDNGVIYHETTLARPEAEAGQGLVPAKVEGHSSQVVRNASGKPVLNWAMATPELITHALPARFLGLSLAALLASLISGLAANLAAFDAVVRTDLLKLKHLPEPRRLFLERIAIVGATIVIIELAFAAGPVNAMPALLLAFSLAMLPLFAVFLSGALSKRVTGPGAFTGLAAGLVAGLAHHGLTLPQAAQPGFAGGWMAPLHLYSNCLEQSFATAMIAFCASLIAAVAISLIAQAPAQK